jgi:TatD DNase family protein
VHAHVHQLPDPAAALLRARDRGVATVLSATERPAEAAAVLALARRFPDQVILAAGLHPATAVLLGQADAREELRALDDALRSAAAVGEIGLDFKYARTDAQKALQREMLDAQLEQAARRGLPVQLHSRRAERQTMEAAVRFTEETGLPALLHWFTHSRKLISVTNDRGVFVSVGPSVLFDESSRKVAALIRPDRLLLETDCPVPIGGIENEPARAADVAEEVARLRGMSPAELSVCVEGNLRAYLRGRGA